MMDGGLKEVRIATTEMMHSFGKYVHSVLKKDQKSHQLIASALHELQIHVLDAVSDAYLAGSSGF